MSQFKPDHGKSTIVDNAESLITLNQSCICLPLDHKEIEQRIIERQFIAGLSGEFKTRANLFASTAIFVSNNHIEAMLAQIKALETAAALTDWQALTLARIEPGLAAAQPGTRGLFMGYDFHITPDGPRLIEINTNAGAVFLAEALQSAASGLDCPPIGSLKADNQISLMIAQSVYDEWRAAGRNGSPGLIAIVDKAPQEQYLYPDMLLAKQMFSSHGLITEIAAPEAFVYRDGALWLGGRIVDMVYNRLTDFGLNDPSSAPLRTALLHDTAVISPAPRHHAVHADKRNLALLSQAAWLRGAGLSDADLNVLAEIPVTRRVTTEIADTLWTERKQHFFKPATGFGSRGVYRGDKLTRRVWQEIISSDYVAQAYVPPGLRAVEQLGAQTEFKFDIRIYTYAGAPLMFAARTYQGQTTNFRTIGGGLAPVIFT